MMQRINVRVSCRLELDRIKDAARIIDPIFLNSPQYQAESIDRALGCRVAGQRYLRERTRLGIPALTVNEGLHGVLAQGATIYPQFLALGCTWNPALAQEMGSQIAEEATGASGERRKSGRAGA